MKLGKKTIALLGVPLGLGIGAAVVFLVVLPRMSGAATPVYVPDPSPGEHGVMLPLEAKVVNLAAGGDYHYAKVGVTIEMRPADASFYALVAEARTTAETLLVKDYGAEVPLFQDAIGRTTSAMASTQLGTPEGRERLRTELLAAFRDIMGEPASAPAATPAPAPTRAPVAPGGSAAPAASGAPAASAVPVKPSDVIDIYFTDLVMQ